MLKPILLRLHRWVTLVFAIPLLVVIGTGLILSFQPIAETATITPGSLPLSKVESLIAKYDPDHKARSLEISHYDNILTLTMGRDESVDIDLATGAEAENDSALDTLFSQSRRLHQRLVYNMRWLVEASTIAMLVLAALGVAMGLPRLRNSVSGWHKGVAWFLLPLTVLSPLTGLALIYNVTFLPASQQLGRPVRGAAPVAQSQVQLLDAVRQVAAAGHDLASVNSMGPRGARFLVSLNDGFIATNYSLEPDGLKPLPGNWPRLIHIGNWSGVVSGLINVVTSLAMLALLGTGLVIWARRTFRRRPVRNRNRAAPLPAGAAQT